MTNANEMAQKGFDTGFIDANDNELHVGDYVRICGHIGKIVFSCGAFGIFIADEVPWDALEELVRKDSGNRASFLYKNCFMDASIGVAELDQNTTRAEVLEVFLALNEGGKPVAKEVLDHARELLKGETDNGKM